jgi:hypothetical protein
MNVGSMYTANIARNVLKHARLGLKNAEKWQLNFLQRQAHSLPFFIFKTTYYGAE